MAKFGPSSVAITCDDAQGGTSRIITPYVTEVSGIKVEDMSEEISPFGVSTEQFSPIGKQKSGQITLKGKFDTAATVGPHVVFGTRDSTIYDGTTATSRTFTFTPGGSKTFTAEVILMSYEVEATKNGLSTYTAVLQAVNGGAWS